MEQKFGFIKMSLNEFSEWINAIKVARTITKVQQHHTYIPSYAQFNGRNHFELQKGMRDHHVNTNGWGDIGQHFTIFPDGTVLTGRTMERSPACIYGQNSQSICIENLGNFDKGKDTMNISQSEAIIFITAELCKKFSLLPNTKNIVYHHWFNLVTGERNNGSKNNKTCPGTNFFSGNKVSDCETYFLPSIRNKLANSNLPQAVLPIRFVCVNANILNVRMGPSVTSGKDLKNPTVSLGAILRVYEERNGWLKIANSSERWVSAAYTISVVKATVVATTLNLRLGPNTSYGIAKKITEGDVVFVAEQKNGWSRIVLENNWAKSSYLHIHN